MKRLVITVAMALVLTGAVFAQSDLQPIANVKLQKTEPITLKQLKSRVEAYQKELGRVMTLDERKQVLDVLINERLLVQAAEKEGVKVSDSEVNQSFLKNISQQVGQEMTEAEFIQFVKQKTGMSVDDFMRAQSAMSLTEYKAFLKGTLQVQRYVMSKKQSEIQNVTPPSDQDIRAYYDVNKTKLFVQPEIVKLFIVVVPKGNASADAKAKLLDLQKQLKDKAASPADIKTRSQIANSGFEAGVLYINKDATAAKELGISMDSLLKIFGMDLNEVSDVSETDNDFQCFVVQEKYTAKILGLVDVVQPGTNVTVYEYIKNNMLAQAQNKAYSDALSSIVTDLRKNDSFQILKQGDDLDKVLAW
jgi:parvulin-like peptidyl-prolyl isomerase